MFRSSVSRIAVAFTVAACACDSGRTAATGPGPDDGIVHDMAGVKDGPATVSHDMAGPQPADMSQPQNVTLTITPTDTNLPVDGVHAGTVTYKAVDKNGADVTAKAKWSIDNGKLGAFGANVFSSTPGMGGGSTVRATVGSDTGYTGITIKLTSTVVTSGTTATAADFNGAASSAAAPTLAYPPDGVLMPPNVNLLEVQWTPGAGNTEYAVHFVGDALDLTIITKCNTVGAGCGLSPDANTWKTIAEAGRGDTLAITVAGTSGKGQPVGTSTAHRVSFADDDIQGGIYYWAASSGGIFRYDWGLVGKTAENWYSSSQAGAICVGCHAMARGGSRVAAGLNIPGGTMQIVDVATRKVVTSVGGGFGGFGGPVFQALTDDGAKIITAEGGGLVLRDATTGNVIGNNPAIPNGSMPDITPDGSHVVFARGGGSCVGGLCGSSPGVDAAGLNIVSWNGNSFGATQGLVAPGGHNNYYPHFSPDGMFVVFNRSSQNSYDAPDAQVMVVRGLAGSPPVLDMQAINSVSLGNSWPKWAPFMSHFKGAPVYWVTFSSRRDYGVHPHATTQGQNMMPEVAAQIWMAAIDQAHLAAGSDGSFPAFWLPFQDPATGNHIAQWVSKVDRAPCSQVDQSGCMTGEMCYMGQCVPNPM